MISQTVGTAPHRSRFFTRWGITLLIVMYALVAFAYSIVVPFEGGPDEAAHFDYMRFIAEHRRLPATLKERDQAGYKSDQPPLYHLLAAIPASFVTGDGPPYLKRANEFPRRQLIENTQHIHNTEDEQNFPGQAEYLMWRLGRWVAILFGAGTIFLTWLIARYFFPEQPELSLAAATIVTFIPRFTLTGSMLNYETLQALLTALSLWILLKINEVINPSASGAEVSRRITMSLCLLLGGVIGLAIITKYSTLLLPMVVPLVLWLINRYSHRPWRQSIEQTLLVAIPTIIIVSVWFGFVLWNFAEVTPSEGVAAWLQPILGTDASDTTSTVVMAWLGEGDIASATKRESFWRWLFFFYHSFWVVDTGGNGLPLPGLLALTGVICFVAVVGLYHRIRYTASPDRLQLIILLSYAGLFLPLPLFRFLVTGNVADTSQGRHWLFPAAAALAILLVAGLRQLTPPSRHRWLTLGILLWLLPWNLFQLWVATWGYAPPLPVRTEPEAVAQAQQSLDVDFGDSLRLVGYNPPLVSDDTKVLTIDLVWQATALTPVDYLTELSVVDQAGVVAAQWFGQPVNGRYPTRAWDPGDVVRDTVHVPLAGVSAGRYHLKLRLLAPNNVPLAPEEGLILTEVTLEKQQGRASTQSRMAQFPATSSADSRLMMSWLISPLPPAPNQSFLSSSGIMLWHPPAAHRYAYRETVVLIAPPNSDPSAYKVWLVDPSEQLLEPERAVGYEFLFIVGPRWVSGDYRLWVKQGEIIEKESETLLSVVNPWDRQFEIPTISQPRQANFANQIKLLGYDLFQEQVKAGDMLPLTIYWQAPANLAPQADFVQFNHLLDSNGTLRGSRDRYPQEDYSTLLWAPGEVIVDGYTVPVDAEATPGDYYLNVGYYFTLNNNPIYLPLVQDGQMSDLNNITIGPIEVIAP